ncbi:MAG TPA: hypothetical protein VG818_05610 [Gemmatimonadaceae bacterium]|nr:hypothetical protein [Gemmatimonadaceae bacterium]
MRRMIVAAGLALLPVVPMAAAQAQAGGNCSNCTGVNVSSSTITGGAFTPMASLTLLNLISRSTNGAPSVSSLLLGMSDASALNASLGASFSGGASDPAVTQLTGALNRLSTILAGGGLEAAQAYNNAVARFNDLVNKANNASLFSNHDFQVLHNFLVQVGSSAIKTS